MKIPIDKVTMVYNGKPGCACGCKGRYFTDARNIARVVGLMDAAPDGSIKTDTLTDAKVIYSIDTPNRSFAAYTGDWPAPVTGGAK